MTGTVRTTCPYCGVGCGVLATPKADGTVAISGDPEHPANFGRLCSKGAALGETLSLDDRLLHPFVHGERASWDTALDLVASRFSDTIAEHGPDSVAFYVSGQILSEDYYVANKLMKGFIGSANIDTNSRLCMASSVAGHRRAFGADTVPGCYEDLEEADLVILVGSNLAWCHPVLFQRLAAAKETRGTKVVVVDPRRTATCEIADMHLAVSPDSDVALFNGLMLAIAGGNAGDRRYVERHTSGYRAAIDAASLMSMSATARATGLSQAELFEFYDLFVRTERVVTVYSQGVNQSTCGTDKVNAIINCHLATGRMGRPGMGPFSVTGQPNAMGGREVGGLANMLAAHMDIENPAHRALVQRFWQSPAIATKPGLKAVDMFRAVADGRIKAIWIMATNPVDSMPEADAVRAALQACPFVVVSDVVRHTDTTAVAHVLLPSLAWGEKDGTVTNSERRISRQRAFLPTPGEARADWWQLAGLGKRMGHEDFFGWTNAWEIFDEYARLTSVDNDGARDLDLGDQVGLSLRAYDDLAPMQWPRGKARFFADGNFFTPDRKARFIATPFRARASAPNAAGQLTLNTGRVRDQWHTMTRTGKAARLMSHIAEPFVEVHPDDARHHGLEHASLAQISSAHGASVLRVVVTPRVLRGMLFAPMHWTDRFAGRARIDTLVEGNVDPVSGQPALKAMPVTIARFAASFHGFAVSTARPDTEGLPYWALARAPSGWRLEFAEQDAGGRMAAELRARLGLADSDDVLTYHDSTHGRFRAVAFRDGKLVAALFIARAPVAVARSWFVERLGQDFVEPSKRLALLAGRPGSDTPDKGAIVCACMNVGVNEIAASIAAGCRTVGAIGTATQAGTSCGSCRSELGRMLHDRVVQIAG